MRLDVFDDSNRKRPAPVEPTDGLDPAKRQRLGANPPNSTPSVPPLPSGPVSFRQLFTLNPDGNTANFDVQAFKDPDQLLRILIPVLHSIDETKLGNAINVRDNLSSLFWQDAPSPGQLFLDSGGLRSCRLSRTCLRDYFNSPHTLQRFK